MGRIQDMFSKLKKEGRPAFIPYLCAGDPDMDTCLMIARQLLERGVDLLEIGVPFSDPLADGLTNQLAAQRALDSGVQTADVFALVQALREDYGTPMVFYTYYNLIHARGIENYVRQCVRAGVDGLLVLDLPPEEAGPLMDACRELGVDMVFIIAPTTQPDRIGFIAENTTGFLYYVSREGVTGEREDMAEGIQESIERIRLYTDLPVVVGFGISTPEQVNAIGKMADGVVVGSSLVRCIQENSENRERAIRAYCEKASWLMEGVHQ